MLFDFIWQLIRIETVRQNHGGKQKKPTAVQRWVQEKVMTLGGS